MHRKRVFLKFIFLYFLICSALWPQTVDPKSDQIPAVMPQCVLQDSYGFIWIGTQEGLLRYDGYKTISYKQTPFDSTSLLHNYVTEIKEDHLGNLWIGTHGGGLNYFDQNTEKFKHYLHDPESENSIGSNSIMKILINDDGSLWLATLDNGFTHLRFDENGRPLYSRYTKSAPPELGYYGIMDMYLDKRGFLWLGTYGLGLERLNIANGEMKSYQHDPHNPASISNNSVHSFCEDDSGNFWMGTGFYIFNNGGGLNKFNPQTEEFTSFRHDPDNPHSLSSDIITGLLIDKDNGLWIGTSGKGLQYIPLNELYNNRKPRFKNVSSNSAQHIYEDRLGNIWVSPWAFYLTKYDYQLNPFYYLKHVKGNPKSLGGRGAFCIYIDSNNNIWIGHSRSGVTKYNPQSGRYKHYRHKKNDQNSLCGNSIRAIAEDNWGNIWFGTETKGIDILDPHTDTFLHIKVDTNDSTALKYNLIRWIIKSHTGDMWIGYNKEGVQLFDKENNSFITYDINPNSIEDESVSVLCEDRSGKLWIGTYYDGLYGVVFENKKIVSVEHFTYSITDTSGLNNDAILDIVEEKNNNVLWIATDCGINRFDLNTGKFTHITEDDGLASNFILKLLQDNSGKIWCTTSDGISLYNPLTGKIINYEEEDGLPHTSFGTGTRRTAKGPDGRLYFGAIGVVWFDPEKITDNPNIPPIRLTDFKIAHKSVRLDTAIQFKKNIILNHEQNAFSFEFSALNFTNPEKNQYAYQLEGLNEDWIYINSDRTAGFTNLDPGEYVFRVKGSNNHGIWNEQGTSIHITILYPLWRTWWAYFFYIIAIGAVLYALRRYDLKRQRLKNELGLEHEHAQKLQEIDRMKSRFFANISHEFRTPLTLILSPIEKLLSKAVDSESKSELSMMQRNAKRLQRLINQLLDLSKLESGGMTIQLSKVNIVELVYSYIQSFESLAKQKRINLKFNAKEDSIIAFVDKDKIEKILNNLLSNAFKFTNEGGKISVGVGIEHPPQSPLDRGEALISPLKKGDKGGCINITISDTGIGIPPSRIEKIFDRFYQIDDSQKREHEGTGIGLALTKELVELHHGHIAVESKSGKGTTFSIYLPAGRDHFKGIEIVDDQLDTDLTTVKEKEQFPIEETFTEYADYSDQFLESKTGKSIILIIEDNPDMRGYIHGYLDKDYKIIEAEDGQQGFDKAIETIPDLIISDVMMPGMDGFELCEKLKTDERTSHIPVILLTARAESDDRIEGLQTGADDYLIKPFDSKELLVRINNLIEQRQKLKERFNKELILGLNDFTAVSIDEKFISRLIDICHKHLTDSNFSVESLSHEASLSRTQLHRKLKGLTGQSATEFIKTLRLKRAALLLREGRENISQIAYEVGFNNLSYFARSFKELFGQTPSEYLNSKENR